VTTAEMLRAEGEPAARPKASSWSSSGRPAHIREVVGPSRVNRLTSRRSDTSGKPCTYASAASAARTSLTVTPGLGFPLRLGGIPPAISWHPTGPATAERYAPATYRDASSLAMATHVLQPTSRLSLLKRGLSHPGSASGNGGEPRERNGWEQRMPRPSGSDSSPMPAILRGMKEQRMALRELKRAGKARRASVETVARTSKGKPRDIVRNELLEEFARCGVEPYPQPLLDNVVDTFVPGARTRLVNSAARPFQVPSTRLAAPDPR
jgi:hypothetical protein